MANGIFALENDEEVIAEPMTEGDALDAVEGEVADLDDEAGSIDDVAESIDNAAGEAETLDGYVETMEDSVEEGEGVSDDAAEILETAIESMCLRLEVPSRKLFPVTTSLESNIKGSSKAERVAKTKMAIEEAKGVIGKIWEKIKNFFKSIKDWLVKFWTNLWNVQKRLEGVISDYQAKVKKLSGEAKEKEFENKTLQLAIGGKTANAATCEAMLEKHTKLIEGVGAMLPTVDNVVSSLEKVKLTTGQDAQDSEFNMIIDANKRLVSEAKSKLKGGESLSASGKNWSNGWGYTGLVNGKSFGIASIAKKGGELQLATVAEAPGLVDNYKTEKSKIPTLSISEMEKVLGLIEGLNSKLGSFKSDVEKINKASKDLDKVIEANLKSPSSEGNVSNAGADVLASIAREQIKFINGFGGKVPQLTVAAEQAALRYVKASMNQYSAAEAKE